MGWFFRSWYGRLTLDIIFAAIVFVLLVLVGFRDFVEDWLVGGPYRPYGPEWGDFDRWIRFQANIRLGVVAMFIAGLFRRLVKKIREATSWQDELTTGGRGVDWFFRNWYGKFAFVIIFAAIVFAVFVLIGLRDYFANLFYHPFDDGGDYWWWARFQANTMLGGFAISTGQLFLWLAKKIRYEGVDDQDAYEKQVKNERFNR